ncbi:MAG: DUF3572 domain-containing protein [Roseinatronobacter sp.]|jgi:hypothetical protein|nr:DUF3572 domain-containing protein [Roseinatronobacter sp.]
MTEEHAETIGLAALGWLCAQDDLLPVFLAASGATISDLQAGLSAPGGPDRALLVAGLDFVLMQDETVIAAAQAQDLRAEKLVMAHALLSGAAQMHWT